MSTGKKILIAGVLFYLFIKSRRKNETTGGGQYTAEKELNLAFSPDESVDGAIVITLWKADEPPAIIQQFLVFDQDTEQQTDVIDDMTYTAGFDNGRNLFYLNIVSEGDNNTPAENITVWVDRFGSVVEYT